MADNRIPAEAFHVAEILQDELEARGWHLEDVAERMTGDYAFNLLYLQLCWSVHDVKCFLGDVKPLADAFGLSPQFISNMDDTWRTWMKANGKTRVEPSEKVTTEVNRHDIANDNASPAPSTGSAV
jgi:plasmid maintenance system antidote protein VapI